MSIIQVTTREGAPCWINLENVLYYKVSTNEQTKGMTQLALKQPSKDGSTTLRTIQDAIQVINMAISQHGVHTVSANLLDESNVTYGTAFFVKKNVSCTTQGDGCYLVHLVNSNTVRTDQPVQ